MEANHKEILENLMHELARINSVIRASSEAIYRAMKGNLDKRTIEYHSELIRDNSFIFSTHLDIVNYQLNPAFFTYEQPDKRSLFGKFHKAILSYGKTAKHRSIEIVVQGDAKSLVDSYPVIDSLPILVIDNAVKYAPSGSEIDIEFYEDTTGIEVSVCNMGPLVLKEELSLIFQRGYRSKEAIRTNLPGNGYGMSFIKHICDIHQAELHIKCGSNSSNIGGIQYAEFKLIMYFQKKISLSKS